MKGKILVLAVLVMSGLVFFSKQSPAQASIAPVLAVDQVFTAINSGELDKAVILFAEDATAENKVRGETYRGTNEIRQMLQEMQREGRRYEVFELKMDGDLISMNMELSDRGIVWGTEKFEARVKDGKVQTFTVTDIRLELWRLGRK